MIFPVILSGGAGSRLWPLSRSAYPKQFLRLTGQRSLIQQTTLRVQGPEFAAPILISNMEHRFLVAEQLHEIGVTAQSVILEPVSRNTAPAAAVAALIVSQTDPSGIVLLMPSDHSIGNEDAFRQAVSDASRTAQDGHLVTFGIQPTHAETGYGYIQRGVSLYDNARVYSVSRFVEKPDQAKAGDYLSAGDYLWNSGILAFRAQDMLDELARLAPALLASCRRAISKGAGLKEFFLLDAEAFASCDSISIDYAVMEHTARAAVVPVSMDWSDIGSWRSLWDVGAKDGDGNILQGNVLQHDSSGAYLRSEGPLIAALGVKDIIVVATRDAVLVSQKGASQDVKAVVEDLQKRGSDLHITHPTVHRPWGSYERIDSGDGFQVKRITVNPGAKISLQLHTQRAEHWIVVSGTAIVTRGDEVFSLEKNQSTYVSVGTRHRLENPGSEPLRLIEVQTGAYCGEDDIVRFDDDYGRQSTA